MSATSVNAPPRRFTVTQRAIHWLMAAAILAMLFIGVFMVTAFGPAYLTLTSIHRPLGIAILLLVAARLVLRVVRPAPPLPRDLPAPIKLVAHLSHLALYALMFVMPLLGWAMLSAAAYPIIMFPGFALPPIVPQSAALHAVLWDAHHYLAFAFFALILLHLSGGLFHALVRRDGVFQAMAPYPLKLR